MKKTLTLTAALLASTTAANALGLDRSGQNIGIIFEDGNYAELSFGIVKPSLTGTDEAVFGGLGTGNVANDYNQLGLGFKMDINEQMSAALIFDSPYGADVSYPTAAEGGGAALGGTSAFLESKAVTALLRYKIDNNWSVHGGLRAETINADITLNGAAYGPLAGYNVSLDDSTGVGFSVGGAYERPDIALRVALTYHSSIEHEFDTAENIDPGVTSKTKVDTPEAINLDFQTGIAADTLLFGSLRWAKYEDVILSPAEFSSRTGGVSLTDVSSGTALNIGVGRRFSDEFSGSISFGYEPEGDDSLVSPLAPSNGNYSVALGGEYKVNDNITIAGGVRYVAVGDASAATSNAARSNFSGNDAIGVGFRVGYSF